MTTNEQRLADALRASIATLDVAAKHLTGDRARMMQVTADAQRAALAAYDAQQVAAPSDGTYTDGPWRMDSDGMTILPPSSDAGGIICRMNVGRDWLRPEAKGNAARIVQCVNAHDGLVSALQGVLACGERYRPYMGREWNHASYGDALDALAAAGVQA